MQMLTKVVMSSLLAEDDSVTGYDWSPMWRSDVLTPCFCAIHSASIVRTVYVFNFDFNPLDLYYQGYKIIISSWPSWSQNLGDFQRRSWGKFSVSEDILVQRYNAVMLHDSFAEEDRPDQWPLEL